MASIQKFLKVGTPVTVRQMGKQPIAYQMKEEVVLGQVSESINPIDQQPALYAVVKGVELWFASCKLRTRILLTSEDTDENVLKAALCQIDYDVPSSGESAGFSPCARLYSVAVPMTESVWLVRAGDVPYTLINEMEDMGCKVDVTLLDLSETQKKVSRAVGFLQAKMKSAIEGANKSLDNAERKLASVEKDENSSPDDIEKAVKAYKASVANTTSRLRKLEKDVKEGTRRFGITQSAFGPAQLGKCASLIKGFASERAKAYVAATRALEQIGTPDALTLAQQARNDTLPAFILSDAVKEMGEGKYDQEANAVNETFNLTDESLIENAITETEVTENEVDNASE
jgi:hypothetical protein